MLLYNNKRNIIMAERGGFEPPTRCREHAFQACALNRSAISPKFLVLPVWLPMLFSQGICVDQFHLCRHPVA